MKILVVASLYPNPAQPLHALFVERRARALSRIADVRVVSPVPSFPGASLLKRYRYRRDIPRVADVNGLQVTYPRFTSVPGLLKHRDAPALGLAVERALERELAGWRPDAIDANLGYPDGAGVLGLARRLGVPLGVTLRGVDVNELPEQDPLRRGAAVREVLREADAIFPVSDSLRKRAIELGARPERCTTVRNGVDTDLFKPRDRVASRRAVGLPGDGRLILTCGHLSPRKRFDVLIDAVARLEGVRLAIVGGAGAEGDVGPQLREQVAARGLGDRVILAGPKAPEELAHWYGAADIFALGSLIEGRPNVVIEAAACGLPVVAVHCWGLPELVPDERYGILVPNGTTEEFAAAFGRALTMPWDPSGIAARGSAATWDGSAASLLERYAALSRKPEKETTVPCAA
jgi:teichuronic acid biosynthesis glycosyltransferase TuaC